MTPHDDRAAPPRQTDDYRAFSDALRRLIRRPDLANRLKQNETTEEARQELGVSKEMSSELKQVLLSLRGPEPVRPSPDGTMEAKAGELLQGRAMDSFNEAERFLERSFSQLRRGSFIMMAMSVTLFLVGVGFLVMAGVRSFTHPESIGVTAVVGGIGIVQIVALFYRNPVRDIARSISNAQQAKVIVMSYMLRVGLVGRSLSGRSTDEAQQQLAELTKDALEQMEAYTEAEPGSAQSRVASNLPQATL